MTFMSTEKNECCIITSVCVCKRNQAKSIEYFYKVDVMGSEYIVKKFTFFTSLSENKISSVS